MTKKPFPSDTSPTHVFSRWMDMLLDTLLTGSRHLPNGTRLYSRLNMRNCLVHINYVNHNPILPNIPADGQRAQGTWSFARRYNNNNISININNNAPSSNGQSLLSFPGFPPSGRRKILSYLQILGPTEIADLLRLAEFYSVLRCPEYTPRFAPGGRLDFPSDPSRVAHP